MPIIMITSRTAEKHRRHALEIGASNYLGKPYDEDELLALIDQAGVFIGNDSGPGHLAHRPSPTVRVASGMHPKNRLSKYCAPRHSRSKMRFS